MYVLSSLPYPKYIQKRINSKEFVLDKDLYLEQWIVPRGTTITLSISRDFGICVLPKYCQDKRGFTIPRRVFRW